MDFANLSNTDACLNTCKKSKCGDGFTQQGVEECDDANAVNTDMCLNTCKAAKCGDGVVQAGVEQCDDGNQVNNDACSNVCKTPTCSDGIKNGQETDVDCGGPMCKPCSIPGLVINEVDYDMVGTDTAEYIEILNTTNAPINLTGYAVVLVNGADNKPYTTISLAGAGTINAGQYLVIAPAAFTVPNGVLKVNFAGTTDQIQNGSPDGLALVNTTTMKLIDALSYEGEITSTTITNVGTVSLVEGMAISAAIVDSNAENASFSRLPNGYDGNNAATDWVLSKTLTPGLPNLP